MPESVDLFVGSQSSMKLVLWNGQPDQVEGVIRLAGALELVGPGGSIVIENPALIPVGDVLAGQRLWRMVSSANVESALLELADVRFDFDENAAIALLRSDSVRLGNAAAGALGAAPWAGHSIGRFLLRIDMRRTAGPALVDVTSADDLMEDVFDPLATAEGGIGPDMIVSNLGTFFSYGHVGDIWAFSFSTVSCNVGDRRLTWNRTIETGHPVISQNVYRLKDDRFEQIGMAWLKHGFLVVNESNPTCGTCSRQVTENFLNPGCSDLYSAGLNGNRDFLGPHSGVNPLTGFIDLPYPPAPIDTVIDGRIQIHESDIDPALNTGARYFIESTYIHFEDTAAGNADDNVDNTSRREVEVRPPTQDDPVYRFQAIDSTIRREPAIYTWSAIDPSVLQTDVRVPGEGLFIMAAKTKPQVTGTWLYEYAIENLSSDRAGGWFEVPIPAQAVVTNIGFHDVDYHSGEMFDSTDWVGQVMGDKVRWTPIETHTENENANALRFGTLYNFRFETNAAPTTGNVTLGLFKPGLPESVTVTSYAPELGTIDCNGNGLDDVCDLSCGEPGGDCDVEGCGQSTDCNDNSVPDECEADCNENNVADQCDILFGPSNDCNFNTVPDECEPDCDGDGIPDTCDGSDADEDGIIDCDDLCPFTSPPGSCSCPPLGQCCFGTFACLPEPISPESCIALGGEPECFGSPCKSGCLIGDMDHDGDLDLVDFMWAQHCFTGSSVGPGNEPSADCLFAFDEDENGLIDLPDIARYVEDLSGPR